MNSRSGRWYVCAPQLFLLSSPSLFFPFFFLFFFLGASAGSHRARRCSIRLSLLFFLLPSFLPLFLSPSAFAHAGCQRSCRCLVMSFLFHSMWRCGWRPAAPAVLTSSPPPPPLFPISPSIASRTDVGSRRCDQGEGRTLSALSVLSPVFLLFLFSLLFFLFFSFFHERKTYGDGAPQTFSLFFFFPSPGSKWTAAQPNASFSPFPFSLFFFFSSKGRSGSRSRNGETIDAVRTWLFPSLPPLSFLLFSSFL